ncbi:MAG TPA: hypothetical protein PLB45_00585 [Bacilli bacterium]|nr:hypothetical protein [Bacilli bacterium]HPZ23692.1 hypothetical protein [Bacilli bacterium]HQC83356.1 hypothetical protein [Bacilli bacterium]
MKKFLKSLLVLLLVIVPVSFANAKTTTTTTTAKTTTTTTTTKAKTTTASAGTNKVNVYIFYGDGCPHCAALHTFTDSLKTNTDYNYMFNIVDYEVWYDETNSALMTSVGKYFNYDVSGVPFFVIGDKYFSGYSEDMDSQIEDAIKTAYNNDSYVDVVAGIGSGNLTAGTSDSTATEDNESAKKDVVGYIILGIALVIVIAIVFSRRSSYDEAEEDSKDEETKAEVKNNETKVEEKVKEEKTEEPHKDNKTKTATKKTSTKSKSSKKSSSKKSTSNKKKNK